MFQPSFHRPSTSSLRAVGPLLSLLLVAGAEAGTYTVLDLTTATPYNAANAVSGGVAAGFSAAVASGTLTPATLWDAAGATDLHPAFLDGAGGLPVGRSVVTGIHGNLQVGWGAGPGTANRVVPLMWHGSADSATVLTIPFTTFGAQAHGTDGAQIVGQASALDSDGTAQGPNHAMLWDAATGAATDLGDGGKGAVAFGVGGGQQVGYVIKGGASAALWQGTSRSLVVLHPKQALTSVANATDGTRQVGYSTYEVRVRREAARGAHNANFSYATVWTGTAASASVIHPAAANAPSVVFNHSYALAVSGAGIAGYATEAAKSGTPAYYHAIVWSSEFESVDLNAFLPDGFVGALAQGIDEDGNVVGAMIAADGRRHAVVWVPNAE